MTDRQNPDHPPTAATQLGDGVWVSWATALNRGDHPLIWHWCDRTVIKTTDVDRQAWWYEPQWVAAGVEGHELISRDPLTLSPSVLWPRCCGLHGFIENGIWRRV